MAGAYGFAHLWQQQELSDVEVVLSTENSSGCTSVVHKFPGHSQILSNSPYCYAQLLRWQAAPKGHLDSRSDADASSTHKDAEESSGEEAECEPSRAADDASSGSDPTNSKPAASKSEIEPTPTGRRLVVLLQTPEQEPAARAVFAALYNVAPIAELLSELPQEQQLHAALLADMWQLPDISKAAVQLLVKAAGDSKTGMSDAALDLYLRQDRYPQCLLPLLKHVAALCCSKEKKEALKRLLLSVLGDLEEVWADSTLQNTLLGLPVPALELLLSTDELKVASEDTVLYTAQRYVDAQTGSSKQQAQQCMADLIRCPHLSGFWLAASVLSDDAPKLLLSGLQPQLKQLLTARQVAPSSKLTPAIITEEVSKAPVSWSLEPRVGLQLSKAVQVQWEVDVAEIRQAGERSISEKKTVSMRSPSSSPPTGGVSFHLWMQCIWEAEKQGTDLGLFCMPGNVPAGMTCVYSFALECVDCISAKQATARDSDGRGWRDYFGVGRMSGAGMSRHGQLQACPKKASSCFG